MTSIARLVDTLDFTLGELEERHARQQVTLDLGRYRGRRAAFAEEVLGVTLAPAQREHLGLLDAHLRVAAYGGNGLGKSFVNAVETLYEVYVENALVIATSTVERQLRDMLMRDVRLLWQRVPDLDGELHTLALRRPERPLSGLLCIAASETSRLRGFHSERVVFLIEEAQGVPGFAFDVAEMVCVGERDIVVVTGNCDQGASGPFYRRCTSWPAVRYNSDLHPNITEGRVVIPGGPTLASRAQRVADYGEGSPFFLASWSGLFPESSDDALAERSWIRAANERWRALPRGLNGGEVVITVDPARFGPDSTALAVRSGDAIVEIVTWNKRSTVETAARVLVELDRLGLSKDQGVTVDEPGLGGGVIDVLEEMGAQVWAYNGGKPPLGSGAEDKFRNLRAESFWSVRRRLERGDIALPPDEKLADELCSMRWSIGLDGKVQIESKEELRARLGRSPDRADAVAMAFADDNRIPLWVA